MRLRILAIAGALVAGVVIQPGLAQAPKPDSAALAKTGILERLAERTGIYGVPPTAKVPGSSPTTAMAAKTAEQLDHRRGRGPVCRARRSRLGLSSAAEPHER